VLYPTAEDLHAHRAEFSYGRHGSSGGPTLRLHIGLGNVDDLKADLERGFAALKAAA
jgi:cystathionine beta-lyase